MPKAHAIKLCFESSVLWPDYQDTWWLNDMLLLQREMHTKDAVTYKGRVSLDKGLCSVIQQVMTRIINLLKLSRKALLFSHTPFMLHWLEWGQWTVLFRSGKMIKSFKQTFLSLDLQSPRWSSIETMVSGKGLGRRFSTARVLQSYGGFGILWWALRKCYYEHYLCLTAVGRGTLVNSKQLVLRQNSIVLQWNLQSLTSGACLQLWGCLGMSDHNTLMLIWEE